MRRLLVTLTLSVIGLSLASGVTLAQDATRDAPFIQMLGSVPRGTADEIGLISYADMAALVNSRAGGFWPQDMEAFLTAKDSDDLRYGVFMAAFLGLNAGMSNLAQVFQLEGMREAVGFDFFTVQRTLEFGQPPALGDVLQGNFDAEAIGAALTGRGFIQETVEGATVWCGPDGCADGLRQNLSDRNPADPFGGMLGRQQPLAFVAPDTLLSSASYDVVQAMLANTQSPDDSILGMPEYRAAAEAITARGTLLQAVLVPPQLLDGAPAQEGMSGVPRYELAVIAHIRDTKDILTLVGLVYPNERLAAQAADMLPPNFSASQSLRAGRLFSELVANRDGAIAKGQTYVSPSSGYAVALLEIRSPLESPELVSSADTNAPRASGLIFRLLIQSLYARETPWLVPSEP